MNHVGKHEPRRVPTLRQDICRWGRRSDSFAPPLNSLISLLSGMDDGRMGLGSIRVLVQGQGLGLAQVQGLSPLPLN